MQVNLHDSGQLIPKRIRLRDGLLPPTVSSLTCPYAGGLKGGKITRRSRRGTMSSEQRRRRFCQPLNGTPNEDDHVHYDSQMCCLNFVAVLHRVARDEQDPTRGRVRKLRSCASERTIVFSKPLQISLYQFPCNDGSCPLQQKRLAIDFKSPRYDCKYRRIGGR